MLIVGLDPGPALSAIVLYRPPAKIIDAVHTDNYDILFGHLKPLVPDAHLVIEDMANYNIIAGQSVFRTMYWVGRFAERWLVNTKREAYLMPRTQVKLHLCDSRRAQGKDIRDVLINRFGPQGTKKEPGPTYLIKNDHYWSAWALAVTYADQKVDPR